MNRKAAKSLEYLSKISHDAIMCGKGPLAQKSCKDVLNLLNWINLIFVELRQSRNENEVDWKLIYNKMYDDLSGNIQGAISYSLASYIIRQNEKQDE